eukprot:3089462-Amphidinium_carterae.1
MDRGLSGLAWIGSTACNKNMSLCDLFLNNVLSAALLFPCVPSSWQTHSITYSSKLQRSKTVTENDSQTHVAKQKSTNND